MGSIMAVHERHKLWHISLAFSKKRQRVVGIRFFIFIFVATVLLLLLFVCLFVLFIFMFFQVSN